MFSNDTTRQYIDRPIENVLSLGNPAYKYCRSAFLKFDGLFITLCFVAWFEHFH